MTARRRIPGRGIPEQSRPCQGRVHHHAGGDIGICGQRSLDNTDIDILFARTQNLRCVIINELPMVPDYLLGAFEHHLADASVESRFKHRADKSVRLFGGYNMSGCWGFLPDSTDTGISIPGHHSL